MFSEVVIRGIPFRPALFLAPLAGLTHCSLRRLVAEFGGCGGFYTEMLSARQILHEDLRQSPYLRRSPGESRLFYQLMVRENDPLEQIVGRLGDIGPDGIDINLACHAPAIRQLDAGSRLFQNLPVLEGVLRTIRRCWPGILTVKIRLGSEAPGAEERFVERMKLFEDCGVDAIALHPRFFEDKFKRRARYERFAWAASLTRLPLIANGDILGPATLRRHAQDFLAMRGLMIGRMAVAQPWFFAAWGGPVTVDHADVWRRLHAYICADFPPDKALGRIKLFSKYYARNFKFGHQLFVTTQNATSPEDALERANAFFAGAPCIDPSPSMMGL